MATLVIARLTFHEAARRKILWLAFLLGLAFLVLYGFGFNAIQTNVERTNSDRAPIMLSEVRNFLVVAGFYVVNFLSVMMTVLTSVDTLSGEISSGTIQTILAKPVRRWEILIGKWLGFAGMVTLYLLLMAGGLIGVVYVSSGYTPPGFIPSMGLLWLNYLLLLSLSFFGGTILSTLANGVLVFGLFGLAFIGGWIEQIGSVLDNQTAIEVGIISSLILPSEALWKRAAFEMQTTLARTFGLSPFISSSVPSLAMIVYAVLYTGVALTLALWLFSRRDL